MRNELCVTTWVKSCINDLAAPRQVTVSEQLGSYPIKHGLCSGFTDPVLECPEGGAIRDICRLAWLAGGAGS